MSAHHVDAAGIRGIGAAQHRINIGDLGGLRNSRRGLLNELVGLDLQAVAALVGVAFELALDPLGSSACCLYRLTAGMSDESVCRVSKLTSFSMVC